MTNPLLILGNGAPDNRDAPAGSIYIDGTNLPSGGGISSVTTDEKSIIGDGSVNKPLAVQLDNKQADNTLKITESGLYCAPNLSDFKIWDGKTNIAPDETFIYRGGKLENLVTIRGTLLLFGNIEITSSGNLNCQTGSILTNYGKITIDEGTKDDTGKVTGGLLETNGVFFNASSINIKGYLFIDGGGFFHNDNDLEMNNSGDLEVVGTFYNTGQVNLYGTSQIRGQTYSKFFTSGYINLNYASVIELSSRAKIEGSITIANNCALKIDAPCDATVTNTGSIENNGAFAIAGSLKNSGIINIWAGQKMTCLYGSSFQNSGTFHVSASAAFEGDGRFVNDWNIEVDGALIFDGDVKATFGINSIITIAEKDASFVNNGSIKNFGEINGFIIGNGKVSNAQITFS